MIEVFSRTGLYIIGFKVHRMSVAQAEEFYGPVLAVLEDKLGAEQGPRSLGGHCRIHVRQPAERDERRSTPRARHREMHRDRLPGRRRGPQNPRRPRADRSEQGASGSIRREFGQTIMVNAAHASDSAENAKREMGIVQVSENNLKPLIENFYARP